MYLQACGHFVTQPLSRSFEKFINLLHNHFDASYRQTFFAVGVNAPKDKMAQCRVGAKIGTDDMKSCRLC